MYENKVKKIEKRIAGEQIQEKDQAKKPNEETAIEFKNTIASIVDQAKIENENELIELHERKPFLFQVLPEYIKKINELYGDCTISIDVDIHDPEDELLVNVQTKFTVKEVLKKENMLDAWSMKRKNPEENLIVILTEAKD